MNCRRAQQCLTDDHDGRLPQRDAEAVAAHLARCPACSRLRAALAAFEARVRATTDWQPTPPPDLGRRAVDRWSIEAGARRTGTGHRLGIGGRLAFRISSLAVLALLGNGLARWDAAPWRRHAVRIANRRAVSLRPAPPVSLPQALEEDRECGPERDQRRGPHP